jgi:cytochrome P450
MSSETEQQGEPLTETDAPEAERDIEDLPLPPYPSEYGHPQFHIVHQIRNRLAFSEDVYESGDVVRTHVTGQGDGYTLGHPDHMKRVLLTEREKFRKTSDFRIAFGEGVLTVEGEEWRQQRDVLQPLFTRRSVVDYADGMVEQVRRRTDTWADGDRLDLQAELTDMTLDVIFATVLGRELELGGDERIREAAEALHDWFVPSSYFLPEWVPTPSRRRFKAAKATIEEEAQRLLDEKSGNAPADPSAAEDLLSLLVGLRESGMEETGMLTDERLRDQMVTIIFAGHDTRRRRSPSPAGHWRTTPKCASGSTPRSTNSTAPRPWTTSTTSR